MRPILVIAVILTACTGASERPDDRLPTRGDAAVDAARVEVRAIRAAAIDATAALEGDAALWERARQQAPTPFVRDHVQQVIADHAARHGLALSRFRVMPPPALPPAPPAAVHPAAPYPVEPEDALVEVPIRFVLTPLHAGRIEAFVRSLPEAELVVIVRAIERGADFVEVEASAASFRAFDPAPRHALEIPAPEALGVALDSPAYRELDAEVRATNEALAALSEARLRRIRLEAWKQARARSEANAATIPLPPPARPGGAATRTEAENR